MTIEGDVEMFVCLCYVFKQQCTHENIDVLMMFLYVQTDSLDARMLY
jgi:hypothetical protein